MPLKLTPYLYNLVSKSWYDSFKFKRLLIDLGAITSSISGISQLEALQQLNNKIGLNRATASLDNFVFDIRKTLVIEIIQLKIPMALVTFYIVKTAILFLLCLVNMN